MWKISSAESKSVWGPCTSAFAAASMICILLHTFWRVCYGGLGVFFLPPPPSCCMLEYNFGQGKESNNIAEEKYLHQHPLSLTKILRFTWARNTASKRVHCKCTQKMKPVLSWPLDLLIQLLLLLPDARRVASPSGFQVLSSSSGKEDPLLL